METKMIEKGVTLLTLSQLPTLPTLSQLENIIIYNIISFFKTLKVGIKTVAILIRGEC